MRAIEYVPMLLLLRPFAPILLLALATNLPPSSFIKAACSRTHCREFLRPASPKCLFLSCPFAPIPILAFATNHDGFFGSDAKFLVSVFVISIFVIKILIV